MLFWDSKYLLTRVFTLPIISIFTLIILLVFVAAMTCSSPKAYLGFCIVYWNLCLGKTLNLRTSYIIKTTLTQKPRKKINNKAIEHKPDQSLHCLVSRTCLEWRAETQCSVRKNWPATCRTVSLWPGNSTWSSESSKMRNTTRWSSLRSGESGEKSLMALIM